MSFYYSPLGAKERDGSRYVVGELVASGSGASEGMDGVDVIETDGTVYEPAN